MVTYLSFIWIVLKAALRTVIEATSTHENAWVMYVQVKTMPPLTFIHQFLGFQL